MFNCYLIDRNYQKVFTVAKFVKAENIDLIEKQANQVRDPSYRFAKYLVSEDPFLEEERAENDKWSKNRYAKKAT